MQAKRTRSGKRVGAPAGINRRMARQIECFDRRPPNRAAVARFNFLQRGKQYLLIDSETKLPILDKAGNRQYRFRLGKHPAQ